VTRGVVKLAYTPRREEDPGMRAPLSTVWRCAALIAVVALSAAASATAAVPAWTTYDHDGARSATDPDSGSPVTPAAAWGPVSVDGAVYAQPLVFGSRVYVATENDTLYALDAVTGAVVWQHSLGTAVPSGDLPCGDISPTVGITSTPAIDPASGRLYAVADVVSGGAISHELFALDAATGSVAPGFPVAVDPPGSDHTALLQRASLALDGSRVIIPYGGNAGDCGTYHGWLVSVATDGSGTPTTFEVNAAAGQHGGAIWGGGDAPAVDSAGHVLVETGNGFRGSATTPDLQESVVELDPTLNILASWTPANWQALDDNDTDLGSMEPLQLPGGMLFVDGKDGVGRLISATALGTTGQVFNAQLCSSSGGAYGAPLYHAGVIYVPCAGGLTAVSVAANSSSFTPLLSFAAPSGASGPPIFAGGLVWSTGWRSSQILYGLDPSTGAVRFQQNMGTFDHFATPSAGGGRLFVAAGAKVSALTIAAFPPATTTGLRSSLNPATAGRAFTLTAAVAPAPDAGTVAFTSGAAPIGGCGAVPVSPTTGIATCRATLTAGTRILKASYGGDAYFAPSSSGTLSEVVRPPAPALSHVRVAPRRATARRGITLRLTLSEAAQLHVQINHLLSGRRVGHRCRVGAKRGARCTVSRRARRSSVRGRRGANHRHLSLRRLAPGRYSAVVSAVGPGGRRSRAVTVRFQVVRSQR
jgi:outer membrane protein assembly factor BamB